MFTDMNNTALFFHDLAPLLTANLLTLLFVYSLWAYDKVEKSGWYLWAAMMVILLAMYGWYTWGVKPPIVSRIDRLQGAEDVSSGADSSSVGRLQRLR